MRGRTVAILALGVFLLGGACGALYAVVSSHTSSGNDKLPVGSYTDLENGDKDKQDNQSGQDNTDKNDNSANNADANNTDNDKNNSEENNSQNNTGGDNNTANNTSNTSTGKASKSGEVNVREDSALTLRQGPGTNYEKIGQIYRGDLVDILEEKNDWYKIKTYDGKEAWVSAKYINVTE